MNPIGGMGNSIDMMPNVRFEVIVVGAGHAGCEAALAAARMGCRTALLTLDSTKVALMPCNPSVGGPGKGHLVREIDALGGEMGHNTDRTGIQIRMLNTGKGPAVQSLRAQCDKHAYSEAMRQTVMQQPGLEVFEASVDDLVLEHEAGGLCIAGIRTGDGTVFESPTVVLTTGTFLRGRVIVGDQSHPGGREGEFPADALSQSLAHAGFCLGRLKTGTPPRVHRSSIDWSLTTTQEGSEKPLFLSFTARQAYEEGSEYASSTDKPIADIGSVPGDGQQAVVRRPREEDSASQFETRGWRQQLNCFLVHTNSDTHRVIRTNLHRAPMFNGEIRATGPRYCPSIEAKIVRFADKASHQLFLEPEGWHTDEIYIQGANTSLPADVQLEMLRSIPSLRSAEIARVGYAIEYDYIPGFQVHPTLESKPIKRLFLAGQIIGTTGYEEAGCLGLMSGINAARSIRGREPVVLRRDQAYIGVLVDDLVTKTLDEPYRMHTSQAEYRLLLREDSAEARLSSVGNEIGLLPKDRYVSMRRSLELIDKTLTQLDSTVLTPNTVTNRTLETLGAKALRSPMTAREALRRADITIEIIRALCQIPALPEDVAREVETTAKYEGYIARQAAEVRRLDRMEQRRIPEGLDYGGIQGLRTESREKLAKVQPRTIAQAARIGGVPPSDVALLLFHLEKTSRERSANSWRQTLDRRNVSPTTRT